MPGYEELRTLAFRLGDEVKTLPFSFYQLHFPEEWKRVLRELQAEATGRDSNAVRLPMTALNAALRALVPDLIYIAYDADKKEQNPLSPRPWLYSEAEIDPEALIVIVHSWVRVAFSKASIEGRQAALASIRAQDLMWKKEPIDLAQWTVRENGTAAPSRGDTFILLPHLVAAELSRPGVYLAYGAEHLHFRRAPLPQGKQGAELVSWPPIAYERWKKRWYYSIMLTFTVQTVPFQHYPVIHCEIGVRRWAGPPIKDLRRGNTSVYLLTSVPWIKGLRNSPCFSVAPLERKTYASKLQWGNSLSELIKDIQLQTNIPEPETLVGDPEAFLNLEGKHAVTVAVVYRYGMTPEHGAKPGLMPGDRRGLVEKIAEFVAPMLSFTDALKKVPYVSTTINNPFFTKEAFAERRQLIAYAVGELLTLEIWHQPDGIANILVRTICDELGLVPLVADTATPTWTTKELTVTIQKHSLGVLGGPLDLENTKGRRRERLHAAIAQRIRDVERQLAVIPSLGAHAAFIELADAEGFKGDTDPKYALRLGFANRGRVTQFITPPGDERDDVDNRARQAFLDLLRQLGVCLQLPQTLPSPKMAKRAPNHIEQVPPPQPGQIHYAAIWSIRQNASGSQTRKQQWLPVLVHISSEGQVRAISPGMSTWEPYARALRAIAMQQIKGGNPYTPQQMLAFIKEKIEEDIAPLGETLILCHSQNIRAIWPWISNNQITRDGIAFGGASQSAITIPGLHIVRIRGGDSETPEWYAQSGTRVGFARGLFKMNDHVFASTQGNPPQFKTRRGLSKAPRSGEVARAAATPAWNPGLYELAVVTDASHDAWRWAALTHELRQSSLQYSEATALPLPLHLAKGIEEYSAPLSQQLSEDVEENAEE
jgi:pPIWI_RE module N-terminal domain/RNaseH domain of pPIWI_RE/MID domain of pPIWI_RE